MKNVMFNKLSLSLFILLIALFTSCGDSSEYKFWGLKGRVKKCTERVYYADQKDGEWELSGMRDQGNFRVSFDEDGKYTGVDYFNSSEVSTGKLIPVREMGRIVEEPYYDELGVLIYTNKIKEESGGEQEYESFDNHQVKTGAGKMIRKNGRLLKQIYRTYIDDEVNTRYTTEYEYDKDGNMIVQKQMDGDGDVKLTIKFEYLEFDNIGNWTKRLVYEDDWPATIVVREIEYY